MNGFALVSCGLFYEHLKSTSVYNTMPFCIMIIIVVRSSFDYPRSMHLSDKLSYACLGFGWFPPSCFYEHEV